MKVFRRNPKYALILMLVLAMAAVTTVVYAADVVIDGFSNQTHEVEINIPEKMPSFPIEDCSASFPTNTIGGARNLCLRVTAGDLDASGEWRVSSAGANQYVSLALDPSVRALAVVQWDGDGDGDFTINPTGLGSEDLVDATNDGIAMRVMASDSVPKDLTVRVYTDGSNWAEQTIPFNSTVTTGQVVDLFLPFDDFGGEGNVVFEDVGAVELEVDATATAGADINIRLVRATSIYEYGDLPTSFSTAIRDANHIPQGLRLGSNLDAEAAHQPNGPATGDDSASTPDDEDGVVRSDANWNDGNGDVTVTVNGCIDTCYLNGWIEFGDGDIMGTLDFDFADADEYIIQDFAVTANGAQNTPSFTIPAYADMTSNSVYARFRVCPTINTCDTPTAVDVTNGEIEDYLWEFGPTAITLQNATAENPQNNMVLALVLGMVGLGITSLILHKKQRATGN